MAANRYVVLGLANVRSTWFREVGRWATAAAIPVDFVKCVSVEEVRARLNSGRSFSAVLFDAATTGMDRDLIDIALQSGAAVLVVDDGRASRDWLALGATALLPEDFHRGELMDQLDRHGRPLDRSEDQPTSGTLTDITSADWSGRLVAVTGGHGAGTSTMAMALAQGLAEDPRYADLTLLADLALHANLAMLHDARDIVPGVQELVEAHRTGNPSLAEVRNLVFDTGIRGYHLLLGLRRHRDWTVLRQRALHAALASLTRSYRVVVADIEADFEGEDEVGSADVEDRNLLARTTVGRADLVVCVGAPTTKGLHDMLRVIGDLVAFGVDPVRIVPVLNRSARAAKARAELAAAFGELVSPITASLPSPLHVPERRKMEETVRDGVRLPEQLTRPVTAAVTAMLDQRSAATEPEGVAPVRVLPGSLGHYEDDRLEGEAS